MDYKTAKQFPKGGAVAMTPENLTATGAEIIARRLCINPAAIYNWLQIEGLRASDIMALGSKSALDKFDKYILNRGN